MRKQSLLRLPVYIFIALVGIPSAGQATQGKSIEELAALFAKFPEGTGFSLSPKGDKFFARMPQGGDYGLMVFDVSDPNAGLAKGSFIKPNSLYEVAGARWVDNDHIGYALVKFDSYNPGFQIALANPSAKNLKRYAWVNNKRKYYRSLSSGLPMFENQFLVSQREFHNYELDLEYESPVLMQVNERLKAREIKSWRNPDLFKNWIFRGNEPYAVVLDDDGDEIFTMDFEFLASPEKRSSEAVRKLLVPLDFPGKLLYCYNDYALLSVPTEDGDKNGLAFYDLNKKEIMGTPLFAEGHSLEIGETAWVRGVRSGLDPVVIEYETDMPQCHYLDPGIGSVMGQLEKMIPDGIPEFRGLSADNRLLYYEIRSDTRDSTMMRLDLQSGSSEVLFHSRPWMAELDLTPMKPVTFENREGQTIHAYLILPKNYQEENPVPLVALSHGGPWARDSWGFDDEAQFYASLGFAVLKVNYRGSKGFGIAYEFDEDMLDICDASPRDVIDGVKWAIDRGYADRDKIGFVGASFGAYLSLYCAALEPDLPACAIGFAGVYDLGLMKEADEENRMPWTERLYGEFEANEERVLNLSPSNHADKIKAPILLVHGGKDSRVGYRQADAMADALKKNGGNVEVVKRRFLLHGFANEEYKRDHYVLVGEFLRKHLGD